MPARPIIDEREFLELLDKGMHPSAIARHFGVTPAAITKKLKKYRPTPVVQAYTRNRRQDETDADTHKRYTEKKARYVEERLSGKNPTAAAMVSHDCNSLESAAVIGNKLEHDPLVKKAIQDCLLDEGVTTQYRAKKIKGILEDGTFDHQLKALDMIFRLDNSYPPARAVNLNISSTLSDEDLARLHDKYRR